VLGSGILAEAQRFEGRGSDIRFLRGPLTHQRVSGVGDVPYGDLGLLSPILVAPVAQQRGIAIVPHYADQSEPAVQELFSRIPGAYFVDVRQGPIEVLKAIASAERVITSSLHGLICGDAYGIPSVCVRFGNNLIGGEFKFHDYMQGIRCDRPIRSAAEFAGKSLDRLCYKPNGALIRAKQRELHRLFLGSVPALMRIKVSRRLRSGQSR
jgi:pyruvyltransferase